MIGNQTIFKFKENVHSIWNKHKENFKGLYKVVEQLSRREPIYHDDYIEPYDYKTVFYILIEDVETKEQHLLNKTYFMQFFEPKGEDNAI